MQCIIAKNWLVNFRDSKLLGNVPGCVQIQKQEIRTFLIFGTIKWGILGYWWFDVCSSNYFGNVNMLIHKCMVDESWLRFSSSFVLLNGVWSYWFHNVMCLVNENQLKLCLMRNVHAIKIGINVCDILQKTCRVRCFLH